MDRLQLHRHYRYECVVFTTHIFALHDSDLHVEKASVVWLQNKANCDSKFMRLTCNAIPNSSQLRGRWSMPLGVIVHPLAGEPVGIVLKITSRAGLHDEILINRGSNYFQQDEVLTKLYWTDLLYRMMCLSLDRTQLVL